MIEIELLNPPAIEVDLSDAMQGPAGPPGNQQASPANTLIGNATGATANPTALAPSTVKAMLGYTTQAEVDAALLYALPAPLRIADGRVYTVPPDQQVAFRFPIKIEAGGVLRVRGAVYRATSEESPYQAAQTIVGNFTDVRGKPRAQSEYATRRWLLNSVREQTADPEIEGELWNDNNTLKFSAGVPVLREFFFDGRTGDTWSTRTNCTAADDTVLSIHGTKSLRVTPTGSTFCNISQTLSPALNLSAAQLVVRFYLNLNDDAVDTGGTNRVDGVSLRLRDATNTLQIRSIWNINQRTTKGWVDVTCDLPTLFDGVDLSSVSEVMLTMSYNSGYSGWFVLDHLILQSRPAKARVMLRLDDGDANHINLATIADSYGIPLHLACVKGAVGNANFLSLSEFQEIVAMPVGHIVCNHSNKIGGAFFAGGFPGFRWADAGSTVLTPLQTRITDIVECRDYMTANGLDRGARYYIVPGGWDNRDDIEIVDSGACDVLWYAGAGDIAIGNQRATWPVQRRQYRLYATALLDGLTDYEPPLQTVLDSKSFGVLYGHQLDTNLFEALCDRIATERDAGNLLVMTLPEILNQYVGQ